MSKHSIFNRLTMPDGHRVVLLKPEAMQLAQRAASPKAVGKNKVAKAGTSKFGTDAKRG